MNKGCWICLTLFFVGLTGTGQGIEYYGTKIGKLNTHFHDVVGDVFAVDDKRLFVKGFSYDGAGPDAFFWAGTTIRPDATGFIIPDENGSTKPLKAYRNKDLLLKLPEGKSLKDIKWIAVWCRKFNANFGDLIVPRNLHIPRPTNIGKLSSLQHGVSSGNVMVLDSRTLLVPDFTYDGQGPGNRPSSLRQRHPTRVPSRNAPRRTFTSTSPNNTSRLPYIQHAIQPPQHEFKRIPQRS